MIATVLLRLGALFALCGMALGIAMGIRQDFTLAPAHAHINLVGFVGLFLAGLYYRLVPEAAASALAKVQASIAIAAAVIFPLGIAGVLLSGRDSFEVITVIGALLVFAGMALFAVIVFRTSGSTRAASSVRTGPPTSAAMSREGR